MNSCRSSRNRHLLYYSGVTIIKYQILKRTGPCFKNTPNSCFSKWLLTFVQWVYMLFYVTSDCPIRIIFYSFLLVEIFLFLLKVMIKVVKMDVGGFPIIFLCINAFNFHFWYFYHLNHFINPSTLKVTGIRIFGAYVCLVQDRLIPLTRNSVMLGRGGNHAKWKSEIQPIWKY